VGSGSGTVNGFLGMSAIGTGITYYSMPSNAYLSASIGTGSLNKTDVLAGNSDNGLALDTTIGKVGCAELGPRARRRLHVPAGQGQGHRPLEQELVGDRVRAAFLCYVQLSVPA
jgi:hypothetical protein